MHARNRAYVMARSARDGKEFRMITNKVSFAFLSTVMFIGTALPQAVTAQQSRSVSPVAPRREQVESVVKEAYEKFKGDTNGKNADYIPYLAHVDSKLFGIAIVTTDNQVLTMGDVDYSFSIQSISKAFTLALALNELGADKVFEKIGSEPPGVLSTLRLLS
jgi:glutaminase